VDGMVTAGDDVLRVHPAPKQSKNRLTIKVLIFYCQPIVMAYCQHVNRW